MFDLEQSIADWRKQMLAAGIKTPVPLEELEIHLREEIERQMKLGLNEQKAFEVSVQQIGQPKIIDSEFKKSEGTSMKKIGIFAVLIGAAIILRILTEHPDAAHYRPNEQVRFLIVGGGIIFFGLSSAFFYFETSDTGNIRLWKTIGIIYSTLVILFQALPISLFLTVPEFSAAVGMTGRILVFAALAMSSLSILGWRKYAGILPIVRNQQIRIMAGIAGCILGLIVAVLCPIYLQPVRFSIGVVLLAWALATAAVLGGLGYGLEKAVEERAITHS